MGRIVGESGEVVCAAGRHHCGHMRVQLDVITDKLVAISRTLQAHMPSVHVKTEIIPSGRALLLFFALF